VEGWGCVECGDVCDGLSCVNGWEGCENGDDSYSCCEKCDWKCCENEIWYVDDGP